MPVREAQLQLLFRTLVQSLLLALVMAVPCATSVTAQDSSEPKRVLIMFGNDSTTPGRAKIDVAISSTLKSGSSVHVETYPEYIGDPRLGTDYEKELVALIQRKYEGKKFDVIFAYSQSTFRLLLRNRAELFPGTPIVFLSLDQRNVANLYPAPGVTGVWGAINFKPNLELALRLHPGTSRVVVMSGVGDLDKYWTPLVREDFRAYQSSLEFTYLIGLTVPEMRKALAGLPSGTIVFFVSSGRDNADNTYESADYLKQVSSASSAPIYGTTENQLGQGIVGGSLLSLEALGVEGGRVGLRLLAGEKPESIAPHGILTEAMFDWRQLRRWGISEDRLPPGSVVRFKELTFWDRYKWRIIAALTIMLLQSALIALLLFEKRRRQHAWLALNQSEKTNRNLAAIVETSDDAILSNTLDGKITTWNTGAERIYGYTTSEIVGRNVSTLAPAERKEEVTSILEQLQRGESVHHLETVRMTRDGQRIEVSLTVSPLKDEHGIIIGSSTIARDITRRKRAEMETRRQRNELAHLSRVTMLGELSSSLAHELNQPLGAILRNTDAAELFLQDPSPDLEELRAILADIRKDDQRAGALIDRMRSMVKRREFEPGLLDLNLLVSEVIGLVGPEVYTRKVQLTFKPAPSLPSVSGDRIQLQQVVLNLLLNAMDALNGSELDRRLVDVCVQPSITLVEVAVSDTGHGIPSDRLAHIFDPFFTTKPNGMGMGLAISRTIIEAHGGTIRAENNANGGAAVYFTVPAAQEERAS
jgi:PAS domain S-box-containing protein